MRGPSNHNRLILLEDVNTLFIYMLIWTGILSRENCPLEHNIYTLFMLKLQCACAVHPELKPGSDSIVIIYDARGYVYNCGIGSEHVTIILS